MLLVPLKLETAVLLGALHIIEATLEGRHRHGFVFRRCDGVRWDTRNGPRSVQWQFGRWVLAKNLLAVHLYLRLSDVFKGGSFGHVMMVERVVKGTHG